MAGPDTPFRHASSRHLVGPTPQCRRPQRRRRHFVTLAAAVAFTSVASFLASTASAASSSSLSPNAPPPRLSELGADASGGGPSTSRSSLLEEVLSAPLGADLGKGFDAGLGASQGICRPTGQIHDACCDYETVEKRLNTPRFFETLSELVKTNYFRYYKVDLFRDCPFWVENGLCMNRACTVEKADEVSQCRHAVCGRVSAAAHTDRQSALLLPSPLTPSLRFLKSFVAGACLLYRPPITPRSFSSQSITRHLQPTTRAPRLVNAARPTFATGKTKSSPRRHPGSI